MFNEPITVVAKFTEPLVYGNVRAIIHQVNGVLIKPIDGLNVITTKQTGDVEFYGWASPVAPHVDGSGYIFICPIYKEYADDTLIVNGIGVNLQVGQVYLVDDQYEHSTKGNGHVVAMFKGAYKKEDLTPELIASVVDDFRKIAFDFEYVLK